MFDVLMSVGNGNLHTTEEIYPVPVPDILDRAFSSYQIKQFEYFRTILKLISDGLIAGDKLDINGYTHYRNLRLTKTGKEFLRFGQLTLQDIDNGYGKDSIKNWLFKPVVVGVLTFMITALISGVVGFYFGKLL